MPCDGFYPSDQLDREMSTSYFSRIFFQDGLKDVRMTFLKREWILYSSKKHLIFYLFWRVMEFVSIMKYKYEETWSQV